MARLDRLVELQIPEPPGANAGLSVVSGNPVVRFRLGHERVARITFINQNPVNDTYLRADRSGDFGPATAVGTWLAGSVIRWTHPLQEGVQAAEFLRPVTWAGPTLSLKTGQPHRTQQNPGPTEGDPIPRNPSITDPSWDRIIAVYYSLTNPGLTLDVSGVLPGAGGMRVKAWARLLDEQYDETETQVGAATVPQILGTATWLMRRRHGVIPLSTLYDDSVAWHVIGVRNAGGRRSSEFVEVDVSREFVGVG